MAPRGSGAATFLADLRSAPPPAAIPTRRQPLRVFWRFTPANGMTSLMGLWTQMRAQLEWIRQHNRTAAHPVGFYGKYPPGDPPPNKPRRHPHRWI
jgi:hypothetical protein